MEASMAAAAAAAAATRLHLVHGINTTTTAIIHRKSYRVDAVAKNNIIISSEQSTAEKKMTTLLLSSDKTVYHDKWFDLMATNHLSRCVQAASGISNCNKKKGGYEGLMEAVGAVYNNFDTVRQRLLVMESLDRAVPSLILNFIRMVMPQSKFAREYYAAFTAIFFVWLVGDCEVKESEVDGRREKNVVHIKKCRFLEESSCVGMCLNLCKVPSQAFVKETLGMPLNMVPNFEDMSCEMVFGQEPLAAADEPLFKQPCYNRCNAKRKHSANCASK